MKGLPTSQFLKEIAQYATDESENKLLAQMGSSSEEGKVKIEKLKNSLMQ